MGLVKDQVCVPPLPSQLQELNRQALESIYTDTLRKAWDEFTYRLDVVSDSSVEHTLNIYRLKIKTFWVTISKNVMLVFVSRLFYSQ
jgi:hypothetical protein